MHKTLLGLLVLAASIFWPWSQAMADNAKVKTIFDYKQELSLSDGQIASIQASIQELGQAVKQGNARLSKLEKEYKALIAREDSSVEEARAKLEQIAEVTVQLRLYDLKVSRQITAALTPEQRTKWKALQAQQRKAPKTP